MSYYCYWIVFSILFHISLCTDLCDVPGCLCEGSVVRQITCQCNNQQDIIINPSILVPETVHRLALHGCNRVILNHSTLHQSALMYFVIRSVNLVKINILALKNLDYLTVENVKEFEIEPHAFDEINEIQAFFFRNVQFPHIYPKSLTSKSNIHNITFIDCTFKYVESSSVELLNAKALVAFISCQFEEMEKNSFRLHAQKLIMEGNSFKALPEYSFNIKTQKAILDKNQFLSAVRPDSIQLQASNETIFYQNHFRQLNAMLLNGIQTSNFIFKENTIEKLNSFTVLPDSIEHLNSSSNVLECHCDLLKENKFSKENSRDLEFYQGFQCQDGKSLSSYIDDESSQSSECVSNAMLLRSWMHSSVFATLIIIILN